MSRQVWRGTPKPDTLRDEPPAQSTGLWSNVAIPGHSATSSGTTGSSKTTEEALITGTCASECCLHTGQEVKGYGLSGSRAPTQTLLQCKVSSPELCLCCRLPKSEQQQQVTACGTTGSPRRQAKLKGTCSARSLKAEITARSTNPKVSTPWCR